MWSLVGLMCSSGWPVLMGLDGHKVGGHGMELSWKIWKGGYGQNTYMKFSNN